MVNRILPLAGLNAILISLFLTLTGNLQAQINRCGTVEAELQRYLDNPDLESYEEFEAWLAKKIAEKEKQAEVGLVINGVYQIPVIVHVVHNGEGIGTGTNISAAAIQSQIDVLNEDFRRIFGSNGYNTHPDGADTQIEFCLARRKPDGTAFAAGEDGINRINRNTVGWTAPPYSTAYVNGTIKPYTTVTQNYNASKYMNFWCMDLGSGLLGYAQFPTTILGGLDCDTQSANTDGVVMLYSSIGKSAVTGNGGVYNEGRTATHEIGHWLGLRHIWGDGGCGVDDFCLDTPDSDAANYGCQTGSISCGSVDMVENYMDYSDDLCMNIFTNDQKMRMRTVLENSPIRASLINSDACIPPAVSDASIVNIINPIGDNCAGAITPVVSLRNRGSSNLTSATISYTIDGGSSTSFSWTGTLAAGATTNVTLPAFTAPLGSHIFSAVSTLPNGVTDPNTDFDASEITFAVSNGFQPNFSEDFDGGYFPPNVRWNVNNPNNDCYEWVGATGVSSAGVENNACAVMTNFGNATGQDEYFNTPIFILPCNATTAELRFDVAYRRRTTAVNDRLRVEISTDCGATWNATAIYDKSGTVLHTNTTATNSYWVPSASTDWRNEVISLASFVGVNSSSVRFRFRGTNTGSSGGNIYVDNVQLVATTPAEINLTAVSGPVLDGGFYNYGSVPVGSPVTAVFTIQNSGTTNLTLTGPISVTGTSFTLGSTFGSTTVLPNQSTTFSVTFNPASAGTYTGNVSFGTNDCDESTYNFVLNGSTTVTPPTANFSFTPSTICAGNTITYTDNSTAATSWAWTFPGGTPASATGVGPHTITYSTPGTYGATLVATNTFGSNTATQSNIINVLNSTASALPLSQGFVSATFPPTNWSVTNGGNGITWARSATQGTAPTAGNSAFMDNFTTNIAGDEDDLNVQPVSLTGLVSAQLTFDVAHARYSSQYIDQLDVLVSTDCGQTYTVVYSKSGTVLATQADQTTAYTAPTTWRNETVDLTPYVGASKLDVKFRNISGYGQYIYIDNVNITGVGGVLANFTATPNPACVGQTVTYTNTSNGATSYNWNFGVNATPATATTAGPHTVTYSVAGTKNVSLSINSGASVSNQTVTISPTQSAAFSYGASTYCTNAADPTPTITGVSGGTFSSAAGLSINASTGAIDVSASTAGAYTVTYASPGPCGASATASVTITGTPSAPTVTVANNCGNSVLTTSGSNLLWSNGATTPSITVTSAGTYTVTQTVSGCISASGSGIAAPIAIPSAPTVTVVNNCGNSVLTATGSNLLWSNGATTSSITVTSAGTYTVTRTVSGCTSPSASGIAAPLAVPSAPTVSVVNNCGNSVLTSTGSNLLWSNSATTASITVTSAGTYTVTQTVGGCTSASASGIAAPLTVPGTPAVTVANNCGNSVLTTSGSNLLWSNGATTPSITVVAAGTYSVTQTVGGCISSAGTGTAVPLTVPNPPVVSVINNCGNSVLSASGSNLLWSNGATSASITVTSAGNYSVTQTLSVCPSSPAVVNAAPIQPQTISADVTLVPSSCGAADGGLGIIGSGSGIISWTGVSSGSSSINLPGWVNNLAAGSYSLTFNNGCISNIANGYISDPNAPDAPIISVVNGCGYSTLSATGTNIVWSNGAITPSITVSSAGTYTATQSLIGCLSYPGNGTAAPFDVPEVTFNNLPTVCDYTPIFNLSGGNPSGGTYSGPGVTANQFDPTSVALGTWTIDYTFVDANGCEGTASATITVDPCVGIEENSIDLGIYPNPTNGQVTVLSTMNINSFKVYDNLGRVILSENTFTQNQFVIDLSSFADGLYNLQVNADGKSQRAKIILKK